MAGEAGRVAGGKAVGIGETDQLVGGKGKPVGQVLRGGQARKGQRGQRRDRTEGRWMQPGGGQCAGLAGMGEEAMGMRAGAKGLRDAGRVGRGLAGKLASRSCVISTGMRFQVRGRRWRRWVSMPVAVQSHCDREPARGRNTSGTCMKKRGPTFPVLRGQ